MCNETPNHGIPEPEGETASIDTYYDVGQENVEGSVCPFGFDIHNPVFMISGLTVAAFVFYTLAFHTQSEIAFNWLFETVTQSFDWFFLTAANLFVLLCLFLIVSPWGKVRLGG